MPTIRRAASRGNCVSVSSVMTYRTFCKNGRLAHDYRKTMLVAAQHRIQVGQLAAFALVAHPDAFWCIPTTGAVKEVEDIVANRWHIWHSAARSLRAPVAQVLHRRAVSPPAASTKSVSKAKCRRRIAIGQVTHFEPVQQMFDAGQHS